MTDYAKLESELRKIAGGDATWDAIAGGDLLACKVADALAQAVRELDELAASAERAAELARQRGDDLIKAEAELAIVRDEVQLFHKAPIPSQYHGRSGFNLDAFLHDYAEWRQLVRALKTKEPT